MKYKNLKGLRNIFACSIFVGLISASGIHAAPGNLAQQPLFLGSVVQPNIFFSIDDSGSMGWETTLNDGTWNPGGVADTTIVHPPTDQEYRRAVCLGYNVLAYNPAAVYTPWRGENSSGNPYTNATLANAYSNPYTNSTTNIANHVYFIWTDADMDGQYDGPGSTGFLAPIGPGEECGDLTSNTTADAVAVNTLPATLNLTDAGYPNSQQNYANWYSYYKERDFVAKRAMSELIFDSTHRMGLATLHNRNNVGTPVEDMTDNAKKFDLLDNLGQVQPGSGTPLRRLLRNTGRYFDNAGNNNDHSALGFTNSSPILPSASGGECQQNFTVLISDGFWNGGNPGFGNEDGDNDTAWDGGSHADTFTETLADVAMYYYETDLATGLTNNVNPITGVDENEAQHLTTFTVAFGIDGTLTANPPNRTDPFAWPQPVANANTTTDDMRHAAWNARGEFLSAKQPGALISALEAALSAIDDRIGTATAVTFNSNQLDTGSQLFLTQFNTEDWSGEVLAFDLDPTDGSIVTPEVWNASAELDGRTDASVIANRVIYTYNGTQGNRLLWNSLTTAQQNDFKTNPDATLETTAGFPVANARLNYTRGDRSNEASGSTYNFRPRGSRLADIVHAGPQFVGQPNGFYPDKDPFGVVGKRYSDFKTTPSIMNRPGVVYVGANDGMLHAFNADNIGTEIMAYVPNSLFSSASAPSGLHYLTDPAYTHSYYVDLPVAVSDAYISTSSGGLGSKNWTTVLAGGLRAGGQGVFALDVTSPSAFTYGSETGAQNTVLWEFDSGDSSFVGFTYGEPKISLMNNGEWAVIFGNGYNSANGEAAVIILFIEEGVDGTWSPGDFRVLETDSGSVGDNNGIGQITLVDLTSDGVVDRVYGGDLKGNLWAFDVSATNDSSWDVAYNSGSRKPLFTASDQEPSPSTIQQVTVKAAITRTETTTDINKPNVLVLFGTGQYLTTADPTNTDVQSFYGVWDAGQPQIRKDSLVEQSLLGTSTADLRVMSDLTVNYQDTGLSSGTYGWFFDLPSSGERVIVNPLVRGAQIIFGTIIPDTAVCSDGGGSGWLMVLDAQNGGEPTGGGIDVNNDGNFDSSDQLAGNFVAGQRFTNGLLVGIGVLGNLLYQSGTGGTGAGSISTLALEELPTADVGRLSWQELVE